MRDGRGDAPVTLGGKRHDNLSGYIEGLLAAVRTHQRLTEKRQLEVRVEDRAKLPLAQAILLR